MSAANSTHPRRERPSDLALHHLYRAMAWLGEELAADQQAGATGLATRTVKDLIEEQLFARKRPPGAALISVEANVQAAAR